MTPDEAAQALITLKKLDEYFSQGREATIELVEPFKLVCPKCKSVIGVIPSLTGRVVIQTTCTNCRAKRLNYHVTVTVDANAGVVIDKSVNSGNINTGSPS